MTNPPFILRPYAGAADHAGMTRANMAARRHEGILEVVTEEGMANRYANLQNCDPFTDTVIAEVAGAIAGYGRVEWGDNTDGGRDYTSFGLIDPAFRRRGIGRAMLLWLERRGREIAATQPTDRPRFHASFVWDRDTGALALLRSEGYVVVRRGAEMVRPTLDTIPDAPLPAGVLIRPGTAEDARAVWDANAEIFRDHWGTVEDSPEAYAQFLGDPRFDPTMWVVAWAGDAIAGVVRTSLQPGATEGEVVGYLDSVGVRRPWRRLGVGRAIVVAALRLAASRGATSAGLGVDLQNENAAARLYESVGFRVETTSTSFRKPLVPADGVLSDGRTSPGGSRTP